MNTAIMAFFRILSSTTKKVKISELEYKDLKKRLEAAERLNMFLVSHNAENNGEMA